MQIEPVYSKSVQGPPYRPLDAQVIPRFAGVRTFMRAPHVTDLHGVTGRDIMDRLIAGERDPKVLAQLARGRARRKIPELEQALEGAEFFTDAHAALLRSKLDRIDVINADIAWLSQVIEELPAPYEEQLQQAESMPGWRRRSAEDAIAGTGVDMTRFRTPARLASRAGRTPLDKQSGKRAGQAKHKRGNRYPGAVTGETAVSAGKTGTREGARYRKLARSRGKAKACVALGNTVKRQALVMGFSDTFMVLGVVLLLSAAAILLTRKVTAAAGGGGAH